MINVLKLILFSFSFLICLTFILTFFKINTKILKIYQICVTFILQFLGIYLWTCFDPFLITNVYNRGFQFFFFLTVNKIFNINLVFGLDSIALIFILLTFVIFTLCFFAIRNFSFYQFNFFFVLLILEFILILIFSILDLFTFYIFFEGSLIPMFFIVGFWGSRTRRIKAAFYLFLYTMATALLTLTGIFYIISQIGTTFYPDLLNFTFSDSEQIFLWFFFFLTFATKIPVIPVHIWLPEAHVEAPTIGSIILASILLKLGGFGCLRYLIPLFPFANNFFLPLVFTIGISSVIYASLITIRQIDLKRIIAYSSIAHMNMVVLGLFTNNFFGIDGAIYLMVGHGIVSSALFFLVGILYDRYHSRLLRYYSGLITVMPLCGIYFFLFLLGNIGFPGTSNFIGEILILLGVFYKNPFICFLLGFGVILSAIYSIWLFNRIFFGTLQITTNKFFFDINFTEFYILNFLFVFMIILGLNSNFLLDLCFFNTEQLLIWSTIF